MFVRAALAPPVAALLVAGAAAGAPRWLPPVQLSPPGLETRSRRPGSAAWEQPVEVARPGVGSGPRVAVDDAGHALAVWRHDTGADRVLQASYRRGASGRWPEPSDLSENGAIASQEAALDGAGNATTAWTFARGGSGYAVQAEVRPAASGIWGAPAAVSRRDGNATGGPPLAVNAGGDAIALWVDGTVQASFRPGALSRWQSPVEGNVVAVWTDTAGRARAALRPGASGAWLPPVDVSSAGGVTDGAHVAVEAGGRAVALWTRVAPSDRVVEAADLAVGGPVLTNLRIPSSATVRRPVSFSVASVPWLRSARPISGAVSRRYRLRPRDAGALVACRVDATNAAGSRRATSRPVRVRVLARTAAEVATPRRGVPFTALEPARGRRRAAEASRACPSSSTPRRPCRSRAARA